MIPKFRAWDKENKIMLAVNNICNLYLESEIERVTVLGNIYENPELLEE